MPQLGPLDPTIMDAKSLLVAAATVNVYREGATISGDQAGVAPLTVAVRHPGKIIAGDTVFIENDNSTTYSVGTVTATTMQLSGFVGALSVLNGQRIVPSNNQPTIYSDDQGGASVSQPLTSDLFGSIATTGGLTPLWTEGGAYHVLAAKPLEAARLYQVLVVAGEAPGVVYSGERDGATAVAHVEDTRFALTTVGGKLKSWRNLGLERNFMRYTGVMAGEIRYADTFAFGSSTGGIQEALNDLPATGGIVWGPALAASITATITIATAKVALMLMPVALTFGVGKKLVISANDVSVIGAGDASLLDFSAETGAVLSIDCTGDRIRLRSFKMACGRIAGCTGSGIQLSTTDTAFVDDVTIDNAGSAGIKTANVTDIHISACRITSSRVSGIFCDSGLTGLWVRDNTLTTCVVDDTAGHSSIAVRGNISGAALDSDIHILDNRVFQTKRVGITVNGGSSASFQTKRVWIRGNHVDQTLGTAGEGIAGTFNEGAISGNRVDKTGVTGILLFATASKITISDNIISNSSQGAGSHSPIQLFAENSFGSGLISDIIVHGNVVYDDQGSPTQGASVSIHRGTGGSFARIAVYGQIVDGTAAVESTSQNSIIGYNNLNDDVNVRVFGNSQDFVTQNVTAAVTTLTVIAPVLYLTADNSYTLTAAPTVNDGYDGQLLNIINVDSADVITIQDQGTLASSNLRLNAATRALGPRDNILLRYSAAIGDWVEVAFTNVI